LLALAVYALGPLPFQLLPGALFFLIGYTFNKRFTLFAHQTLDATDGLATLDTGRSSASSISPPPVCRPFSPLSASLSERPSPCSTWPSTSALASGLQGDE